MRIVTDGGSVPAAMLDGAAVSHDLAGVRFEIGVGDDGGLVCRLVAAPGELRPRAVRAIAEDAIEAVDPRKGRGATMTAPDGAKAWVETDPADDDIDAATLGLVRQMDDADLAEEIEYPVPFYVAPRALRTLGVLLPIAAGLLGALYVGPGKTQWSQPMLALAFGVFFRILTANAFRTMADKADEVLALGRRNGRAARQEAEFRQILSMMERRA